MRNKNNIRKNADTYHDYLAKREGYDPESLEEISDPGSPYYSKALPPVLDDAYEKLEKLYYNGGFKGRQQQILTLLFHGFIDMRVDPNHKVTETEIARELGMTQAHVADELRKIFKKIC